MAAASSQPQPQQELASELATLEQLARTHRQVHRRGLYFQRLDAARRAVRAAASACAPARRSADAAARAEAAVRAVDVALRRIPPAWSQLRRLLAQTYFMNYALVHLALLSRLVRPPLAVSSASLLSPAVSLTTAASLTTASHHLSSPRPTVSLQHCIDAASTHPHHRSRHPRHLAAATATAAASLATPPLPPPPPSPPRPPSLFCQAALLSARRAELAAVAAGAGR